jgi:hypothetical protein
MVSARKTFAIRAIVSLAVAVVGAATDVKIKTAAMQSTEDYSYQLKLAL